MVVSGSLCPMLFMPSVSQVFSLFETYFLDAGFSPISTTESPGSTPFDLRASISPLSAPRSCPKLLGADS